MAKLFLRGPYSLRFSGTQQRIEEFTDSISNRIDSFCFSPDQIARYNQEGKQPWKEARKQFGCITPNSDGKLGELLLYLFVESVLRVPLMAHKISFLTNPNDQVKGGDGVFLGNYGGSPAVLIGEAKVKADLTKAIKEAFASINRFHKQPSTLGYEITIAPRMVRMDLTREQLDHICDRLLNPSTQEFKTQVIVHPMLIVYSEAMIGQISREALTPLEAEAEMGEFCCMQLKEQMKAIEEELALNDQIAQVFLDIFFLPISDVNKMRACFYEDIHGVPYNPAK